MMTSGRTVMLTILMLSSLVQARDSIDQTLQKLKDKDSTIRCQAAETLGQSASADGLMVEALRGALADADHDVRGAAALALYRLGPDALKKANLLEHMGYDPIESSDAAAILEKAWSTVNAEYPMFGLREGLDWNALRSRYLEQAREAKSVQETGIIVAQMFRPLRDAHLWVKLKGKPIPVFKVEARLNVNRDTKIYGGLLGRIEPVGRDLMWAKTKDNIGWIMFPRWDGADLPDRFDEVMEQMRDTRGLIVDVRWNGGGDAELSKYIAARFLDRTRAYSFYQYRNGPDRSDLTKKIEQTISPRGPWRYDRPVILLMGQGCISACESFCAMMAACPNVTTMGDRTRGATGFPVPFRLGHEIEIHVPQWLVTLPDGQVVDGRGVLPEVPFVPKADSFTDNRDELLSLVLTRLRKEPLPAAPMAGPTPQAVRDSEKAEKSCAPKVVSVEPGEGSRDVTPDTELHIRFDRPMLPSMLQLTWQSGGFHECDQIRYDETKYEFTLPIHLAAGCQHRLVINPPSEPGTVKGFQSVHRTPAEPMTWTFSTQNSEPTQKTAQDASDAGKTRSVVQQFNKTRNSMWAFVQTVDTQEYGQPGPRGYQSLRTYTTRFTFNGDREVCADVGEKTGTALVVFNEGHLNHISGCYQKTVGSEDIVFCLDSDITDRRIVIADPFKSQDPDVKATIEQLGLQYAGQAVMNGRPCDILCAPGTQWCIDRQSHLLEKMVTSQGDGVKCTSRFAYTHINEPLHFMAYMPDVSYQWVCAHKKMADPLESSDSGRAIEVSDGTRGHVHATWGREGG
ncbi:MAG: HEAT repeat domain-containing protein [Phycisphaerae bacterium]|nr:HEAT repeat domain-containing protein [Phycisphaerae bacterium]